MRPDAHIYRYLRAGVGGGIYVWEGGKVRRSPLALYLAALKVAYYFYDKPVFLIQICTSVDVEKKNSPVILRRFLVKKVKNNKIKPMCNVRSNRLLPSEQNKCITTSIITDNFISDNSNLITISQPNSAYHFHEYLTLSINSFTS